VRSIRSQRLISRTESQDDGRAGLLAIVALFLLLLPFLLLTGSPQKLAAINLQLADATEQGDVTTKGRHGEFVGLELRIDDKALILNETRWNKDIIAAPVSKEIAFPHHREGRFDIRAIQKRLRALKSEFTTPYVWEKITLLPSPDTTTAELIVLMDGVRSDNKGPLLPEVSLGGNL